MWAISKVGFDDSCFDIITGADLGVHQEDEPSTSEIAVYLGILHKLRRGIQLCLPYESDPTFVDDSVSEEEVSKRESERKGKQKATDKKEKKEKKKRKKGEGEESEVRRSKRQLESAASDVTKRSKEDDNDNHSIASGLSYTPMSAGISSFDFLIC